MTLTNPVAFTATFPHIPAGTTVGFVETLEATGTGTVTLKRVDFGAGPAWDVERVTYDLQATPEPATLLLVGSTAVGLGVARWTKGRQRGDRGSRSCDR